MRDEPRRCEPDKPLVKPSVRELPSNISNELLIACKSKDEVDAVWKKLSAGGSAFIEAV